MPTKALTRWFVSLFSIGMAASACSDAGSPTLPAEAPTFHHVAYADTFEVATLKRNASHHSMTVSATIDPRKESAVNIPSAGFTLWIPKGAIKGGKKVNITIRSLPGEHVAYEFQPHGLVFEKPLIGVQNLRGTKVEGDSSQILDLGAGYFGTDVLTFDELGRAKIYEFEQAAASPKNNTFYFAIPHFSGYMIATGCCRRNTMSWDE